MFATSPKSVPSCKEAASQAAVRPDARWPVLHEICRGIIVRLGERCWPNHPGALQCAASVSSPWGTQWELQPQATELLYMTLPRLGLLIPWIPAPWLSRSVSALESFPAVVWRGNVSLDSLSSLNWLPPSRPLGLLSARHGFQPLASRGVGRACVGGAAEKEASSGFVLAELSQGQKI